MQKKEIKKNTREELKIFQIIKIVTQQLQLSEVMNIHILEFETLLTPTKQDK